MLGVSDSDGTDDAAVLEKASGLTATEVTGDAARDCADEIGDVDAVGAPDAPDVADEPALS